jgi:outer membrane lipoprotein-sorting protein
MRLIAVALLLAGFAAGAAAKETAQGSLTAAQIVSKNVAARGGLDAWRNIRTMIWIGHMESPDARMRTMPFELQQERPNRTRFEINAIDQRSARVFDGTSGWKMSAKRNGSPEVQPFTIQELKFAQAAQAIDGPLIDYEAKATLVSLDDIEEVEGHRAYRLSARLASGETQKVWIDAQTFLDLRYDRTSYSPAGVPGNVSVFYRDYRTIDGLKFPFTLEVGVGSGKPPDKMVIEKVMLNPVLDKRAFAKPAALRRQSAGAFPPNAIPRAASSADSIAETK